MSYVPVWLIVSTPPMILALATIGLAVLMARTTRARTMRADDLAIWVAVIGFVVSLAPLVLLHPVLYNTMRQFLYLFPPLILLAVCGLRDGVVCLWQARRWSVKRVSLGPVFASALVLITLFSTIQVAVQMIQLSPYEYAYFSPVVGGIPGASGKFEIDYYSTCVEASAKWLSKHAASYTTASSPTYTAPSVLDGQLAIYLPTRFTLQMSHPDFIINSRNTLHNFSQPDSTGYRLIHTVEVQGVSLCTILARESGT